MELGSLHKYWLNEANKKRDGLLIGDYSGTGHASAIQGLISLKYLRVISENDGIMTVEITILGRRMLSSRRNPAKL
jgi:hypothetical protein